MYERRVNFTNLSAFDVRFRVRVGDDDSSSKELLVSMGESFIFSFLSIPKNELTIWVHPMYHAPFQLTIRHLDSNRIAGIVDVRSESTISEVHIHFSDYPGVETYSVLIEPDHFSLRRAGAMDER